MIILQTTTKRGNIIALTSERWNHLVLKHPEMENYLGEIKNILQNPDILVQDAFSPTIVFYQKYYKELCAYVVIVVEEEKGFILTGYASQQLKRGYILWQKK